MSPSQISALADKVTEKKNELREKMIQLKCCQLGKARGRLVLAKEITLTAKEKETNMQEAFDTILHDFPFEERAALKSAIGKELNRRKQQRREESRCQLDQIVSKLEEKVKLEERLGFEEELALMMEKLCQEEEQRLAIELLIQAGRAIRDERDNLIIFNYFGEE